jgi:hypothetical protein
MQPLLTQRECAEALALSERTLERFRVSGIGPKFVRCGKATLQNTAVDEVYSALTQAWERDHLRDLANRLLRYLGPPPDLTIPPTLRRPVAPATQ